jgi:hypothetical protein
MEPFAPTRSTLLFWTGVAFTVLFVALDILDLIANAATLQRQIGVDYRLYIDTAAGWLNGGPYFQPHQLAGPYSITAGDILYPPIALVLFVPFTVVPAILWWLIPAAAVGWCLQRSRPSRVAWAFIAACAAWPTTPLKIVTGNPVMWVVAAMALGVVYAWPSVLVLIKPSLFPFALFGIRQKAWWLAFGILALISVPFGSLWIDWIHSVLNSQGGGLTYSSLEIPMLAFPIVAWLGRTRSVPSSDRRHDFAG